MTIRIRVLKYGIENYYFKCRTKWERYYEFQ